MSKIAVFYHCILSGGTVSIDTPKACAIMAEQMAALKESGLADAADEIRIGLNGDSEDLEMARLFAPAKAMFMVHGKGATTEIPTMNHLRDWLPAHPDWLVAYHHIKGVCYPDHLLYHAWRRCLERAVVWGWRDCIAEIERGRDSCGAHWMTPEQFPGKVKSPFWGGTFWWATAKFLLSLPPLPTPTWKNRFEAENWIGRGPRRPSVTDYHNGWPSMECK
jgi:hypothetical protein